MQSLKKNWLLVSNMTRGIYWIFTQPLKSPKISLWWAILVQGIEVWAKKYRGVIFHDTVHRCEIWINTDLAVSKMAWGIGWIFIRAPKILKKYTPIRSFCPKYIMFQLENFRGLCVMTLKGVAKFKGKLTCGLNNDTKNLVKFQASSRNSENWHLDWILLSKAY